MPPGLAHLTTWLIAVAMAVVSVLPPVRVDCGCGQDAAGATSIASASDPHPPAEACCSAECTQADARHADSEPIDHDHGGCHCPEACCAFARPVLLTGDAPPATGAEPQARTHVRAQPQTRLASAHAARLLRPPRA